ncbi:MAG: hypothetical protein J5885_05650 [Clostridia bacterium]|nr:hypothetical protein [Clostridia bacterium]
MKKLIPALAMLLIAAVMLGTSTYAWFSMNTTVTATGMSVTATTPVNLLISNTSGGTFTNDVIADEAFGTGRLYPASSVAGTLFNAIENSGNYIGTNGAGGPAESTTKFQKDSSQGETAVVALANNTNGYWADFTYWLKLSEAQTSPADVFLSNLVIYRPYVAVSTDTGVAADTFYTKAGSVYTVVEAGTNLTEGQTYYKKDGVCKAVRVLLSVASDAASQAKSVIYATDGTAANAISSNVAADGTLFSTLSTTSVTPVASYNAGTANANCFKVNGTEIAVVLRVWIEGQDADCLNANAGQTFEIQVAFNVVTA